MSCHGCATKFGLFTKENGCPICGFSYCGKCLKYKATVPKLGQTMSVVCKSCFAALGNGDGKKSPLELSPPAAYLRRLESLENPAKPPIVVYHEDERLRKLKCDLNEVDREIVNRLEKLRQERKRQPLPNEEEIARRLAMLKNQDPDLMAATSNKKVHAVRDTRTDEEKTNDLIRQLLEEKVIESKLRKPEDEIAYRLSKLRGTDPILGNQQQAVQAFSAHTTIKLTDEPIEDAEALIGKLKAEANSLPQGIQKLEAYKTIDDSSSDEDDVAENVVKMAVDEASLPDTECEQARHGAPVTVKPPSHMDAELPWCIICNEDATKRCHGCDGDLYCDKCYAEGHDVWNMKEHKTSPFK